jgi:hypothetical protein
MALSIFSGAYHALDFAYGTAFSGAPALQVLSGSNASGTYTLTCSPASLKTSDGANIPITVNTPIAVGEGSTYEVVTPTAVSSNQLGQILITAAFGQAHGTGAQVRSGTYGLQEAAQQCVSAANPGGLVILSPAWFKVNGGHTTGVAVITGQKSLATAVYTVLDWGGATTAKSYTAASGSNYAATAISLY